MKAESGTYALLLRSDHRSELQVGRWGVLDVRPGHYIYVGSAFGPGGVKARVLRHWRGARAKHWHIDFLRDVSKPVGAWCAYGDRELEHRWAQILRVLDGVSSVPGFGCSDCPCDSHLFSLRSKPDFSVRLGGREAGVEFWRFLPDVS